MLRLSIATLTVLTLLGCRRDHDLPESDNLPPVATITSHGDPAVVAWERPVLFEGEVSDGNHEIHDLRVTWYLDGEPICADRTPTENGYTACTITPGADSEVVELFVRDPADASGRDRVSLNLVEPGMPSATILEPAADGRHYAGHPIHFLGTAFHPSDPPSSLTTAWSTDLEGALGLPTTPDVDGHVQGTASLIEGTHQVVFEVTDAHGGTVAATREIEVGPPNRPPDCSILSPADADRAEPGEEVLLQGVVTDADQPADELEVIWRSSIDGLLAEVSPDADGNVSHATSVLSAGLHALVLEAVDELGANCIDTVSFMVASAPWAIIVSPEDGDVVNEDEAVSFQGTVGSLDWPMDELSVTWSSDLDGVLHAGPAPSDGDHTFAASLSPGAHLITLSVEDPTGEITEDAVSFRINGLPSAPVIDISPSPAYTIHDLSAVIVTDSVDPEGDEITHTYQWLRDGTPHSTGPSVAADATAKGQTWTLQVTPHDAHGAGAAGVATRVISNTPPTLTSLVLSPKPAFTNDTLVCDATAGDADGDAVTLFWEWTVDGPVVSTAGNTLSSAYFAKGQEVVCRATPHDGTDFGEPLQDSVVIGNSPPVITGVDVSPSPAFTDDNLIASVEGYHDPDDDPAGTHGYTWYRSPAGSTSWSVVGDGAQVLPSAHFSKGDRVYVRVVPRDSAGLAGEAVDSSILTIQNSPPSIASVSISPTSPIESDTLISSVSGYSDPDGDPPGTHQYRWFREPAGSSSWDLLDATGASLSMAGYDVGDRFYVEVTPRDADGLLGDPHDSNIVQIRATMIADRCDSDTIDDDILCVPEGAEITLGGQHCYTDVWILGTLYVDPGTELVIEAQGEIWVGPEGRVDADARGWGGGVPNDTMFGGGGMGLGEGGACGSGPGHADHVPDDSEMDWQTGQAGSGGGLGGVGGISTAPVGETCTVCHEPDEWFCKGERGQVVGTADEPTLDMGGGGGAAGHSNGFLDGGQGGRGGGAVALIADDVIIDGRVDANGEAGTTAQSDGEEPGGGGGAGGTILVIAYEAFSGGSDSVLNALGGGGGTSTGWQGVGAWGGGGGGGGRIKIYGPVNTFEGATSVAGGAGGEVPSGSYNHEGEPGAPGTVHTQSSIPSHGLGVCD